LSQHSSRSFFKQSISHPIMDSSAPSSSISPIRDPHFHHNQFHSSLILIKKFSIN
jgi:hypothetical protein